MGRPCFTFYLGLQIIQAVEDDPSDREQFVNAAAPNNGALSRRCDKQRMLERQVALASCTQPLVARSCAARGVSVY